MDGRSSANRLRGVELLGLDVDGVLTDGGVYMLEDGSQLRRFDIKDGLGIKRLMASGVDVIIISSSSVAIVRNRAAVLGIAELHLGVPDKLAVLQQACAARGLTLDQAAFMGDDLTDLPVLGAVGVPCAPADAVSAVRRAALVVTEKPGGRGAVRELCDQLIAARGASAE